MHKHSASVQQDRANATDPTCGNGAASPDTYALPQVRAAYLDAMRRRAAYLLRANTRGLVYVSVAPQLAALEHGNRALTRVRRKLSPAKVVTFGQVWPDGKPRCSYWEAWQDYADTLTGLVVVAGRRGIVGAGVAREIEAACQRGLPVLVHGPIAEWIRQVRWTPLVDCRTTLIEPEAGGHPSKALRIDFPAVNAQSETLTACLAAMGAIR